MATKANTCEINLQNYNNILLTWLNGCVNNNLIDLTSTTQIPLTDLLLDTTGSQLLGEFNDKVQQVQIDGKEVSQIAKIKDGDTGKSYTIVQGLKPSLASSYPTAQLCYKIVFNKVKDTSIMTTTLQQQASTWLQSIGKKLNLNTSAWGSLKTIYICLFKKNLTQQEMKTISTSLGNCKQILDSICTSGPRRSYGNKNILNFCEDKNISTSVSSVSTARDPTPTAEEEAIASAKPPTTEQDGGNKSRKRRKEKKVKKTRKERKPKKTRKERKPKKVKKSRK